MEMENSNMLLQSVQEFTGTLASSSPVPGAAGPAPWPAPWASPWGTWWAR